MNKNLFILTLLTAHTALGQVGYRSVQNDLPTKKAYDSTVNVENIRCYFDPASMIGQEFYFAKRSPYFNHKTDPDTTFRVFISEKQSTLKDLSKSALNEQVRSAYAASNIKSGRVRSDETQSNLYQPVYIKYSAYSGDVLTPYSSLEDKTFTVTGWDVVNEDQELCQTKVTLKDPAGEKVEWTIGRKLPNVSVFTKGYLEKLKQTWVNQTVYFSEEGYTPNDFYNPLDKQTLSFVKGSKWQCTELTFLFDEQYFGKLHLILRNDAQKEIAVQIENTTRASERQLCLNNHIWSEKRYLAIKKHEKEQQAALLAKEAANKKLAEKEEKERRADIIKRFGATNGNLIADGYVKPGMNQEMCAVAKGNPDEVIRTLIGAEVIETWFYYYTYNSAAWLKFKGNKLIQVSE
jgi:hypothetical protein